jgi:hypothetical protein
VPGDPEGSLLYRMLVDRNPVYGHQMPLQKVPLDDRGKQLVRRWILEGAHRAVGSISSSAHDDDPRDVHGHAPGDLLRVLPAEDRGGGPPRFYETVRTLRSACSPSFVSVTYGGGRQHA